ncbi:hypothetical protein AOQ84DRAFT_300658 [Glonium stellatum]|uniref:gluconokinase n=1 Tax=Glonium stellatum TaxID=574774 RepID=A0A8E2ETF2_9PEZI|nr:hypothetical protein AOQ84DRAFT_300658 [Glonium stellatum]
MLCENPEINAACFRGSAVLLCNWHNSGRRMTNNHPLTDAKRWNCSIRLRRRVIRSFKGGASSVVLSCSALKRKARDMVRIIALDNVNVVRFIYLRVDHEVFGQRVRARQDHFIEETMIKSQPDILEEPHCKERDGFTVNVSGSIPEVLTNVISMVKYVITDH